MAHHKWQDPELTIRYYLIREGDSRLPMTDKSIQGLFGIGHNAWKARGDNFEYLHTGGKKGWPNVSRRSRELYARYKDTPEAVLRGTVIALLDEAKRRATTAPSAGLVTGQRPDLNHL